MQLFEAGSFIQLPLDLGTIRTGCLSEIFSDLLLSSNGTVLLSFVSICLLFAWRMFIDDSEDHENFVETLKQEELDKKWKRHNEKWGTSTPSPKLNIEVAMPLPEGSVRLIPTEPFPTMVTIIGDLSSARTVLITYHDIGMNHRWCFSRLLHCMHSAGMLDGGVAVVNVDAPGHEDGAAALPGVEMASGLNLESCATQLQTVVNALGISVPLVGMGIGAGANVLLRFTCDCPSKMAGLILMNPSLGYPSRCERVSLSLVRSLMSPFAMVGSSVSTMARIHFSQRALACKSLPRSYARCYRQPVEWRNKQWFIDAFRSRDTIGPTSRLEALKAVPMLCFSACESAGADFISNDYTEEDCAALVMELRMEVAHTRLSHMRIKGCGAQLAEERAEEILQPIKLFTQGIGLNFGR